MLVRYSSSFHIDNENGVSVDMDALVGNDKFFVLTVLVRLNQVQVGISDLELVLPLDDILRVMFLVLHVLV